MDWKKQRRPRSTKTIAAAQDDHVALVKAAAWAWYQRGSGHDSTQPATRESEPARTRLSSAAPLPTRYKLEAAFSAPTTNNSTSLLDSYEIERITRELNSLIVRSSLASGNKRSASKRAEAKKVNGLWACGSRDDVVEAAVLGGRREAASGAVGNLCKFVGWTSQ